MMMGWGACDEQGRRKGPWTPGEDKLLSDYVSLHGEGRWSSVARCAGLNRNAKSCRLRWVNYLRPGLIRGHLTPQEEGIIIELHALWGNKWSTIARYLPGRTDNEIKNFWRTHLKKKGTRNPSAERRGKRSSKLVRRQEQQEGDVKRSTAEGISPSSSSPELQPEVKRGETEQPAMQPATYPNMENPLYDGMDQPWSNSIIDPTDGFWGWQWNLDDDLDMIDGYYGEHLVDMHNGVYIS